MNPLVLAAGGGWIAPLVSQILAFTIAGLVIWKFVLPIFAGVLRGRTEEIDRSFQGAEEESAAARTELAEIRKRLEDVEAESKKRLDKALAEAEKAREQSLGEARRKADAALDKARREIQIERDKAVLELRQATTSLTLEAAEHLLRKVVDEKVHGGLVDRYIDDLDKVKQT